MSRRPAARRGAAAIAVIALVAGCGSAITSPIQGATTARAVGQALKADARQPGLTVSLSLGTTAANVERINRASGGGPLSAKLAQAISTTKVSVDYMKGSGSGAKAGSAARWPQVSVNLGVNGDTPVQIREIAGVVYVKVTIRKLLSDYGQSPAEADSALAAINKANATLPGLSTFADGAWVSTNLAALGPAIEKAVGTVTPQEKAREAGLEAKLKALLPKVGTALKDNATFANSGDHGGRTEYTVTLASQAFLDQLLGLAKQALGDALPPSETAQLPLPSRVTAVPASQRTVFQVWVKDNRVEELDVNLQQFDPKDIPVALPLRFVVASGTAVAKPAGAVNVNLQQFLNQFLQRSQNAGVDPGSGVFPTPS